MKKEIRDKIFTAIMFIVATAWNWAWTCILIKLLSLCFGLSFSLKYATLFWAVIFGCKLVKEKVNSFLKLFFGRGF